MLKYLFILSLIFLASGFSLPTAEDEHPVVRHIRGEFNEFATRCHVLVSTIDSINAGEPETIWRAKAALKECRLQYKKFAYFLDYFFPYAAATYNSPARTEVEAPDLEFAEPVGMQVVEALLFEDDVIAKKHELKQHARLLYSSAADLYSLLYKLAVDDKQLMESVRLELVRVMTLTLAGFDAPFLKSGIEESYYSLRGIEIAVESVRSTHPRESLNFYLDRARGYLNGRMDFDSFDRLTFLTEYALPLQECLNQFIKAADLELDTSEGLLNYDAKNLFSADAIKPKTIRGGEVSSTEAVIGLGRHLFFEKRLSGRGDRSCASCHDPAKYFSDGLPRSIATDGHSFVRRNAPTLLYAGLQQNQFWDGRVRTLEEQIAEVVLSADEMAGSRKVIVENLRQDESYRLGFDGAFPQLADSAVSLETIVRSIAAFVRTLQPRDSPFDRYMHGDHDAMTTAQKNGFNLFAGKAMCGTCHFAPVFNGLLPPFYDISEAEILGVPQSDDFDNPISDEDEGRFNVFGISFHKGAFKTPTVRNAAMTGPYMHNGSQASLEKVVDFYNKGGGAGLGMSIENQTLLSRPINLTAEESGDIVQFLRALTDSKEAVVGAGMGDRGGKGDKGGNVPDTFEVSVGR